MNRPFKLHLSDGLAAYIGRNVRTKLHAHHALEIVMSFDKPFFISKNGQQPEESVCSLIAPDVPHQFAGQDAYYIFLFLEGEASKAMRLENALSIQQQGIIQYSGNDLEAVKEYFKSWFLNPQSTYKPAAIIDILINAIAPCTTVLNSIRPGIQDALNIIQQSLHEDVSIENIATRVFLSESRFAHLFKEQTGIPFRKYILWCRLQAAVKAVLQGQSLTKAAYEGGFSDIAHLSRTFTEMFGVSPSDVLKE